MAAAIGRQRRMKLRMMSTINDHGFHSLRYSGNRKNNPFARVAMKWRIEGPNGFAD
jgi:hypothetical protein